MNHRHLLGSTNLYDGSDCLVLVPLVTPLRLLVVSSTRTLLLSHRWYIFHVHSKFTVFVTKRWNLADCSCARVDRTNTTALLLVIHSVVIGNYLAHGPSAIALYGNWLSGKSDRVCITCVIYSRLLFWSLAYVVSSSITSIWSFLIKTFRYFCCASSGVLFWSLLTKSPCRKNAFCFTRLHSIIEKSPQNMWKVSLAYKVHACGIFIAGNGYHETQMIERFLCSSWMHSQESSDLA